jgi:hypothetical protein
VRGDEVIKILAVGLAGILAACVGFGVKVYLANVSGSADADASKEVQLEQVATELAGVPIVKNGKIESYLVLRVRSTINRAALQPQSLDIVPYLMDSTFRAVYERAAEGLGRLRAKDVEQLDNRIRQLTNARLKLEVVQTVNLEQLNLVSAGEVRAGLLELR